VNNKEDSGIEISLSMANERTTMMHHAPWLGALSMPLRGIAGQKAPQQAQYITIKLDDFTAHQACMMSGHCLDKL
jgi:hypothetical protein